MPIISAGKGKSKYNIHIVEKELSKNLINKYLNKSSKILIVTDSGIPKKYLRHLKSKINNKRVHIFTLPKGEKSKSYNTYKIIINKLSKLKFDRTDYLIACGGGVVGDYNYRYLI